jgi:ubiquinone/menaquinone biosynthesis C-methylase UbiE
MWRAAGIQPESRETFRILDVACGCAIKSLALAQAAPSVRVTCLDSADVLDVARNLAERLGLAERVTFHPADLLIADFGASQFEAALVGQITHYLPPEQNRALFRRLHAALTDAGTLVIDCPMLGDTPSEAASFLTLFL